MSVHGAEKTDRRPTVGLGTKIFYGAGQGVETAVTLIANTFLLFYLTRVTGLSPSLAGTMIFLSLVIDALADPLIGGWSDRANTRLGRRLPFMIVAIPIICLSVLGLFLVPAGLSTIATLLLVLLANVGLRIGTSLFALPYSALTAELTEDYKERSSLAVYRMLFAFIGSLAAIAPAFGIIFTTQAAYGDRPSYIQLALLLGAIVAVMALACIFGIRRKVLAAPTEHLPDSATHQAFLANLRDLARNPSFVLLFLCSLSVLILGGSFVALNLYAYNYFWKLPASANQIPILAFQVGTFVGIPATALMLRTLEKRQVLIVAVILIAISQSVPALWLVTSGTDRASDAVIWTLAVSTLIFGACNSMCFIGFQSMIADAIDEHELRFGQRCEGLYYSAIVFSSKAAVGIGSLIAGFILAAVGIGGGSGAQEVSESSATLLGLVWGPGHGLAFLFCLVPIFLYALDRKRHGEIIAELATRRQVKTPA